MLRRRQLSPVELTEAMLERISVLNPALNAFITVLGEEALEAASRAESEIMAGRYLGPLHGVPIAHKDVYLTQGVRTTAHSQVLSDFIPSTSATVVERLAAHGAILLGKLNTYEFACGATERFGVPVNPWDTRRTTGGSSAGSGAAVSASMCFAATGTDTGGSIRSPASYCGVVGLKPTYGRISRAGILPVSWSLDHAGFLTRTAHDAAIMLAATTGYDPRDASSVNASPERLPEQPWASTTEGPPDVRGLRLGVPHALFEGMVTTEVRHLAYDAVDEFRSLGVSTHDVALPSTTLSAAALQVIMAVEATTFHRKWLKQAPQAYAPFTRHKLLVGACLGGMEYLRAQQLRHAIFQDVQRALEQVDALIWPTTYCPAPRVDEPEVPTGVQTRLTNLTGNPSISIPCGFTSEGLPVGVQINGRLFGEATILLLAEAYEHAAPWWRRWPDVSALQPPPVSKPYATPTRPENLAESDLNRLYDQIRCRMRDLDLPLLEEDLEPLAFSLHGILATLEEAGEGRYVDLEPPIHQHISHLPV